MDPELGFRLANACAGAGWLAMLLLPRQRWVTATLCGRMLPILFSGAYLGILLQHGQNLLGGFNTLETLRQCFSQPWLLLAGWLHYLAFDLCLGSWAARDAQRHNFPVWALTPCLVLTFILGPVGFLAYIVLRAAAGDRSDLAPTWGPKSGTRRL